MSKLLWALLLTIVCAASYGIYALVRTDPNIDHATAFRLALLLPACWVLMVAPFAIVLHRVHRANKLVDKSIK